MDILDKNLYNLLVCPLCKEPLENRKSNFFCTKCHNIFPFANGIFSFMSDEIIRRNQYLKEEIGCQDRCLEIYTDKNSLIYYLESLDLKKMSKLISTENCRILDIGCGIGNLRDILDKEIWGIDISKILLSEAKEKEKYVFQAIGNYLPFVDNLFNIIFIRSVLHHSDCPDKILEEAFRVLKPGGLIISADPRTCLLTKVASFFRRNSPYYSSMHRSFTAGEYSLMFEKKFNIEFLDYSFFIFYLFSKGCDISCISKLIPFKNKFCSILFRLDDLISRLFRFMKRYYFMINVVARKAQ